MQWPTCNMPLAKPSLEMISERYCSPIPLLFRHKSPTNFQKEVSTKNNDRRKFKFPIFENFWSGFFQFFTNRLHEKDRKLRNLVIIHIRHDTRHPGSTRRKSKSVCISYHQSSTAASVAVQSVSVSRRPLRDEFRSR